MKTELIDLYPELKIRPNVNEHIFMDHEQLIYLCKIIDIELVNWPKNMKDESIRNKIAFLFNLLELRLNTHLALEESFGNLNEVLCHKPYLLNKVTPIFEQHEQLSKSIEEIKARTKKPFQSYPEIREIMTDFKAFQQLLMEHENLENLILREIREVS